MFSILYAGPSKVFLFVNFEDIHTELFLECEWRWKAVARVWRGSSVEEENEEAGSRSLHQPVWPPRDANLHHLPQPPCESCKLKINSVIAPALIFNILHIFYRSGQTRCRKQP